MSNIAINTSRLTALQKQAKGSDIIAMSTNNPNVPGNTALVTALSDAQAALIAKNNAYEEARQALKGLLAARDAGLVDWNIAIANLASFTESATGGVAEKILTTGFDIRAEPAPPQPVEQVSNVRVAFTQLAGYSEVRWKRDPHADAYVVQRSADPITDTSWVNAGSVSEAKFIGNGAVPGQKCWFRVAALNRIGQDGWSEPALRPVM